MTSRQLIPFIFAALTFSSGCTSQPRSDSSVASGEYVRCGSSFAGTFLGFVSDDRLSITVSSDDGPWEATLAGMYQFDGDRIIASQFEATEMEGPAPEVSIVDRLVWEVSTSGRKTGLELIEATGTSIGEPWFGIGDEYARFDENCPDE